MRGIEADEVLAEGAAQLKAERIAREEGMKERELRDLATCAVCKKKLGASFRDNHYLPLFWKVTFQRFMLDDAALRRQAGLEMMVGHVGIAQALSPNEDLAKAVGKPRTVCMCEPCLLENRLVEIAFKEEPEDEKTEGDGD